MRLDRVPYQLLHLLDVSCSTSEVFVTAPNIPHGKVARYSRVKYNNFGKDKSFMVAIYKCFRGYKLHSETDGRMFCSQGGWIGKQPFCEEEGVIFGK